MDNNYIYTTKEMEEAVHAYISQFKEGYFSPLALMARLTEEVGELAREINHSYGEKPKKDTENEQLMEEEIGDIMFVLICMINSLDLDLGKGFHQTMQKYSIRDKDRWTRHEEEQ